VSLLTSCQAVVRETGAGDVPATIISNTDATAVQLNALAERAAKKIAKLNWEKMLREHTITTVASQENYALPTDWARYLGDTAWDATNYWPMNGSIDPSLWQALKRGIVTISTRRRFRLRGGEVLLMPTPSASGDTLIIEYVRNTPWVNGSTYRVTATADADTTVFPEELLDLDLKWRWLRAKGLDYGDERDEADRRIAEMYAQDTPAPTLNFGYVTNVTPPFLVNVPQVIV
jgi:hypothetical protein